jgi:hypothetical protein
MQTIHFLKTMKEPRFEDYDMKYRYGNRFAFLGAYNPFNELLEKLLTLFPGNGDMKAHVTGDTMGLATYIRNSDHEWSVD